MENFNWECRTKVRFGKGCVARELEGFVREYVEPGGTVMVGYGGGSAKKNGAYDDVIRVLEQTGCRIIEFSGIMSNPTLAKMLEGAELARRENVSLIIAIGGGSVMDCCKAISVQAKYDGDAWQDFWMEGKPMTHEVLPCGVVVTMPATGSEVNGCAVLTNEETRIKTDRDYAEVNPVFALMDPAYTLTMPLRQLRAGTFDILSHIMETYFSWSVEGNPADDVAEGLMRGLIRDFRAALADPQDIQARSNIMWTASLAENRIIKTGKSKDFEAHNMEHQLSAYTNCNHGEGLAVLHPVYYRHIYRDGLGKFVSWAKNVWELDRNDYASDEDLALAGIDALAALIREAGLPTTMRELGFGEKEKELLPEIAESCFISGGAFRPMTTQEILEIYRECW
ncbi:MAG: iron-containing alcohol dehydrogenase [Mogibacterium sp.]|nr:iron-containing alcohol dehydrogenase [Mogibacterium sp.]